MKVEGRNAVRECIYSGSTIEKILVSNNLKDKVSNDLINLIKQQRIKLQFVGIETLNKESATKKHQGFIAYTSEYKYCTVDDILNVATEKNEPNFILILDEVADPHNFGSIIRVCECLGVHGIIISKNRSCPVNETVIKTSAGAINYVKIAKVTNINTEIERLKKKDVWVYACELGGINIKAANLRGNIAIVIGSEGFGVSSLTRKLCDDIITIGMKGKVNSLNASVATGIVLNEVCNQR